MDTNDVTTATKVWRWNSGGLGYSSTGYEGTYTTAITQDGAIVADFITTGTLNASLINVVNLIANHVLADDGEANPLSFEISEGYARMIKNTYLRTSMSVTASGDGMFIAGGGNITYAGPGSSILDHMEDDAARFSYMSANNIFVGCDRNNVRHGSVAAETLYIKSVVPLGGTLKELDWRIVRMADGTTAYALCQKA